MCIVIIRYYKDLALQLTSVPYNSPCRVYNNLTYSKFITKCHVYNSEIVRSYKVENMFMLKTATQVVSC